MPTDPPAAPAATVVAVARAAGVLLQLSGQATVEFAMPPGIPPDLADALARQISLNGRAIARLLEDENYPDETDDQPAEDQP